MHSKNDRLVIWLIVTGSLLMLVGAVYALTDYIKHNRGDKADLIIETNTVATTKASDSTEPLELSNTAKQNAEKKLLNLLIDAINDQHNLQKYYDQLPYNQQDELSFNDFKTYIECLHEIAQGKVVGARRVTANERKVIELEMINNDRLNALYVRNYAFYYLITDTQKNYKADSDNGLSEQRTLVVLDNSSDYLHISQRLLTSLIEPYELVKLYTTALREKDTQVLANLLYSDLPNELVVRLNTAEKYLDYYKSLRETNKLNYRIEEIRPDQWTISYMDPHFVAKSEYNATPNGIINTSNKEINATTNLAKMQVESHEETRLNSQEQSQTSALATVLNQQATNQTKTSLDNLSASDNQHLNEQVAQHITAFSSLYYSPKYYERIKVEPGRHYLKLVRENNNIVVVDNLPLDNLVGAYTLNLPLKKKTFNLLDNRNLLKLTSSLSETGAIEAVYYHDAVYKNVIMPHFAEVDKAPAKYEQLWHYESPEIEAFSLFQKGAALASCNADLLTIKSPEILTNSKLQIGMNRGEVLDLYPSLAAANYRIFYKNLVLELNFDNQSNGGLVLKTARSTDKIKAIKYYTLEWYQQNFDTVNLDIASTYQQAVTTTSTKK